MIPAQTHGPTLARSITIEPGARHAGQPFIRQLQGGVLLSSPSVLLGLAITEHCNLRCPHCIRDDVTTVRNLPLELILGTARDAMGLFDSVQVSMTGGEPTLHPRWDDIIGGLHEMGIGYRFVSNGWHMRRLMPGLDRHPPQAVRISLSGADEEVHDTERGRGSFKRVLQAVALLTSRQVPTSLGFVVDRRDRHQILQAVELAEMLGCPSIHFALAQPVPGSAARDSDLAPAEWYGARDEILALHASGRETGVYLDYGAPFDGDEFPCDTFNGERIYVDARGRLSLCCQLSEYGFNDADVVADLTRQSLPEVWSLYLAELEAQRLRSLTPTDSQDPLDAFPCMRCARSLGKTRWLADHPDSPWRDAAVGRDGRVVARPPRLVPLTMGARRRTGAGVGT